MSKRSKSFMLFAPVILAVLLLSFFTRAKTSSIPAHKTYYVDNGKANASDKNPGTLSKPFLTIQKAASILQPGDICYVRTGTYRERVTPLHGGTSETERIVYKAYHGEKPVIKGSERITAWKKGDGNAWSVSLPDKFFGSVNPYTTNVKGSCLERGANNHLGEVYLDGKVIPEFTGWNATHSDSTTTITCNFGDADPNKQLTEINVRDCVFRPDAAMINYITVDGFEMAQAADNWAGGNCEQPGLISPWGGNHWIIQNCHIHDAKCAGISVTCVGSPRGGQDINLIGHHLIRYNLIEQCGQNGIVGLHGLTASIVEWNLIQDINPRKLFGGCEQGGIKFHLTVDVLVRNNIIRRVTNLSHDAPGIWADNANQGLRISGNIIDVPEASHNIFCELEHGPILIDNNILLGSDQRVLSDGVYHVHNLIVHSPMTCAAEPKRPLASWIPHTKTQVSTNRTDWIPNMAKEDMSFNNIFIECGPCQTAERSDYNVLYKGGKPTAKDQNSIKNADFDPQFSMVHDADGVTITFRVDGAPKQVSAPVINWDFIGINSLTRQGIEDRDGNHITVDKDILGKKRNAVHPTAGPFENLTAGTYTFHITAGPHAVGNPTLK